MGLTRAMNISTSGLQAAQTAIGVVSQNIANADSVGYSRRRVSNSEVVVGNRGAGVRVERIERMIDMVAQRQLRMETSGAAYTDLRAQYAQSMDKLYGQPGGDGSLDTMLNAFTKSLQNLASDPGAPSTRALVMADATALAERIQGLSESVQALRTETEARISSGVTRANDLLETIRQLNVKVVSSNEISTGPSPALLDERDKAINELAKLMDVQVVDGEGGSVSILTASGQTLFDGINPVRLTFDGRSNLLPQNLYSTDPNLRGVGTITATSVSGQTTDLIALKAIRSGEIAAAVELRDQTLVQAQRQLDELAAGLSRALSDRQVTSTSVTVSGNPGQEIDLTGLQAGNEVSVAFSTGAGVPRRVLLIPTLGSAPATIPASATNDPSAIVIPVNISGGINAGAATAIQTALAAQGVTLTVASPGANRLQFVNAGGNTVTSASAGITVTGFASGNAQAPIFVDINGNIPFTGSFDNGQQLIGFSQRIALNPAIQSNPSNLVVYGPSIAQGDNMRPQFLFDALTRTTRDFSGSAGIDGTNAPFRSTVATFGQRIVEFQGAQSEAMQRLDAGQKIALANVESRMERVSGVNVDEELSQLVQLQTAYTANARVMTAVREMMDVLMRM